MSEQETVVKVALNRALLAMLGKQSLVERWWHMPNKYWNGDTPESIYQSGPAGRSEVKKYILSYLQK
jgi:hypothetical protein